MDSVSGVTAAAPATNQTQARGGSSAEQEQVIVEAAEAAGGIAAALFGNMRKIMSDANKPPQ